MNRIVRLTFGLGLILALAACAPASTPTPAAPPTAVAPHGVTPPALPQPTTVPTHPAPTAQPEGLFFARPVGDAGPLSAYDMANGALRFTLPPGRLSADGQHYLAAKTGADTGLIQFNLGTGADTLVAELAGQWELSSVSPTGRWAALRRIASDSEKQAWIAANTWKTDVKVVDTQSGQAARQIELDGNFDVDTLSAAGDSLFVIQYLPAVKPDHYQVRLFDLASGKLLDGALVDKRSPDEVMAGQRSQAVAPRDGSWLFTLYLRTKNNTAFIHALDTVNKYTLCFDLPALPAETLNELNAYSLAVSPDGQIVYASNPALGIVARVDVSSSEVTSEASFTPDPSVLAVSAPVNYSVADKRAVYFTGGKTIWSFDTASRQVKSLSSLDRLTTAPDAVAGISGLALSLDGQRLFVARPDQPAMMVDTASGQASSFQ
jgi:WD40 repeat protein